MINTEEFHKKYQIQEFYDWQDNNSEKAYNNFPKARKEISFWNGAGLPKIWTFL